MSEEDEFEEAIHTIASFSEEILGQEPKIVDQRDSEHGERVIIDMPLEGWSGNFYIAGQPSERSFDISYYYDLVAAITEKLDKSTEEEKDNEEEVEAWSPEAYDDAKELVNSLERDHERDIIYQLTELIHQHPVGLHTQDTENGVFRSFIASTKTFPYEPEFNITSFNREVLTVLTAGAMGETFLNYAFNLGIEHDIEPTEDIPSEPNYPRS